MMKKTIYAKNIMKIIQNIVKTVKKIFVLNVILNIRIIKVYIMEEYYLK